MRVPRSLLSAFACAGLLGLMLGSSTAYAASFTFSGKFTSNRGKIINIPLVGNTPCAPLTLMSGPGAGGTMTPATHMIIRGANTQPQMAVTTNFKGTGRDLLCVKHVAGKKLVTDNMITAMGKGGGFVMPADAFSKPFPPYVRAVEVKYAPPVLQLATSFKITGPKTMINFFGTAPPMGTMNNGANTAPFRAFQQNAFLMQTGRAGAMFTWCPVGTVGAGMGMPCTNINQGGPNLIVKYAGGANAFGGTMAYVINTGLNTSSLGVGLPGGGVGFQILAGMGSQPTGRGYADFLTDALMGGNLFGAKMQTTVIPGPIVGPQKLITMLTAPLPNPPYMLPDGKNFNFGFPLTTGPVLVRNYLTRTTTLTAMGYDKRGTPTPMGNRNISLVAGGLAIANIPSTVPPDQHTPEIMSMLLPEPGGSMQLVAGVAALLGIAMWRSRRVR